MKQDSDPQGWRIAALVVLLAVTLTASAYYIHTQIYCDPAHPTCTKAISAAEPHSATETHAAPHEGATPATGGEHVAPADGGHKMPDSAGSHVKSGG